MKLDENWIRADWTRRQTLDLLAKGGLAAMLAGKAAASAPQDDVVRLGYLPITDATALLVAHYNGYFADEGLESEKPVPVRSWSALVEGFAARKFNIVHLLKPIPVWMRYNNNFPVKVLAWAHTNGSGLVVGRGSTAREFSDLGGTRIAVPYWYSMHNIVLQYALRQSGLTPRITSDAPGPNEVALQILPPPEMPAALAAGKIDGYIVAEPFNALGEIKAGARMLRFTGDIWRDHPCCVVAAHEEDTLSRPEWTQKVTNAIVRAQVWASENKAEAARLISKDVSGALPLPAAVVEKAMTDYGPAYDENGAIRHREWGAGRIDFQPWPHESATRLIVEAMSETVVEGDTTFLSSLDPQFVADDLIDTRFVHQALQAYPDWLPQGRTEVLKL